MKIIKTILVVLGMFLIIGIVTGNILIAKSITLEKEKAQALEELEIGDFTILECVKLDDNYCEFKISPSNPYFEFDYTYERIMKYSEKTKEQLQDEIKERVEEILNTIAEKRIFEKAQVEEPKEYLTDKIQIDIIELKDIGEITK